MKVFLSSPYRSHMAWPDRWEPIADAFMAMRRLRPLRIVYHWRDVAETDDCIWSPLIHGDIIRRNLKADGKHWEEAQALDWCLWVIENGGFTHNAQAVTIPRRKDYGWNGMDAEREVAAKAGLTVLTDVDLLGMLR